MKSKKCNLSNFLEHLTPNNKQLSIDKIIIINDNKKRFAYYSTIAGNFQTTTVSIINISLISLLELTVNLSNYYERLVNTFIMSLDFLN